MAIDKSGKWWIGSECEDLVEYLKCLTAEGYLATQFRKAKCSCGSEDFRLAMDSNESVAKRTCSSCSAEHFICDSGEFWTEAEPKEWKCIRKCKSKSANICVGFALRQNKEDVHFVYIGTRCSKCGILGCCVDWQIRTSPSLHLLDSE